jgi:hypothetical protein
MPVLLIIFTVVGVFFLLRSILILIGLYKDPILRLFEDYGPEEKLYLPALPILAWGSVVIFAGGLWASRFTGLSFSLSCLGVIMLVTVGLGYNNYETAQKLHFTLLKYPRWYHDLRERTSRYERRRIAYMWLHLPARLRLTYNSSDKLFFTWADFVILGTVREEEPDELKSPAWDNEYSFTDNWR